MKENGSMNFNTDGFNERTNYIHNSNDMNRLKKMESKPMDNSFARMKIEENKPDIKTANFDQTIEKEDVRGSRENFIIRNNNIMKVNMRSNPNNPVSNAMNRNMFKKF